MCRVLSTAVRTDLCKELRTTLSSVFSEGPDRERKSDGLVVPRKVLSTSTTSRFHEELVNCLHNMPQNGSQNDPMCPPGQRSKEAIVPSQLSFTLEEQQMLEPRKFAYFECGVVICLPVTLCSWSRAGGYPPARAQTLKT